MYELFEILWTGWNAKITKQNTVWAAEWTAVRAEWKVIWGVWNTFWAM